MALAVKAGVKFGFLTVIKATDKRIKGAKVWECLCQCGQSVEAKTDYLQQGWKKSCGCLRSAMASARVPELHRIKNSKSKAIYKLNSLIRTTKANAKRNKRVYELTDAQVHEIASKPCHYCGSVRWPDQKSASDSRIYADLYVGIDRKDNEKGYTLENSLPCCVICNRGKNNMSYDEFVSYIDFIKRSK